jgi:choline-sulfatase
MLRKGHLKLVYFAEGNPPLLFDLQRDPRELSNLADNPAHAQSLQQLIQELFQILDPEAVNELAFADQGKMIESLGGMEKILAMKSFNHTPLD